MISSLGADYCGSLDFFTFLVPQEQRDAYRMWSGNSTFRSRTAQCLSPTKSAALKRQGAYSLASSGKDGIANRG